MTWFAKWKEGLDPLQAKFINLYVLLLALSWSPSKILGQLTPFAFLFAVLFYLKTRPLQHINRLSIFFAIYGFLGLVWWNFYNQFYISNYLFWLFTASHFVALIISYREIADHKLLVKLAEVTVAFLLLEAAVAFLQVSFSFVMHSGTFDHNTGDLVFGTLEASLTSTRKMGKFFVLLLVPGLLFYAGTRKQKLKRSELIKIGVIGMSWIFASFLHSYIFFIAAVFASIAYAIFINASEMIGGNTFMSRLIRRGLTGFVAVVILFTVLLFTFMPNNLRTIPLALERMSEVSEYSFSPKNRVIWATFVQLPKDAPWQPIVGLGAGQYCSRAGLVATGQYASGGKIPGLPVRESRVMKQYIMNQYAYYEIIPYGAGSTTMQPYSSWLALYGEFGWLGTLGLVVLCMVALHVFLGRVTRDFPYLGLSMGTLIFFLLLMGTQNIYWDYSQALLPGFILLKVAYDYMHKERGEMRSEQEPAAAG